MRLVLAFSDNFVFRKSDVVIRGHAFELPDGLDIVDINSADLDEKSLSNYFEKKLDMDLVGLNEKIGVVLKGCNNNIYTNHLSVFKWAAAIQSIMDKGGVKEIVFTDSVRSNSYSPYYEAEGESHTRLFYKPYDFIPLVLLEYLKFSNPGLPTSVHRWHSRYLRWFRIFLRRDVLLCFKIASYSCRILKHHFKKSDDVKKCNEHVPSTIFVTRSSAHFDGLQYLSESLGKDAVFFCGEGLFTFGKNFGYTSERVEYAVSFLDFISFRSLLGVALKTYWLRLIYSFTSKSMISFKGVEYSFSSSVVEMIIANYEVEIFERSFRSYLHRINVEKVEKKPVIFCAEMYTPYALTIANIGNEVGAKTVQIQTTNMFAIYEPDYMHCDYFIYSSKVLRDAYVEKYPFRSNQVVFWGNYSQPIQPRAIRGCEVSRLNKVVYFTQPLTDEDIEQDIIQTLCELSVELDFSLYVKLHPRDKPEKLAAFDGRLMAIAHAQEFDDYMADVDLAVLKTSSIASRIVLSGIPVLYCLLSEWARNNPLDYIDYQYFGTCKTLGMVRDRFYQYSLIEESFGLYRDRYIESTGASLGLDNFVFEAKNRLW